MIDGNAKTILLTVITVRCPLPKAAHHAIVIVEDDAILIELGINRQVGDEFLDGLRGFYGDIGGQLSDWRDGAALMLFSAAYDQEVDADGPGGDSVAQTALHFYAEIHAPMRTKGKADRRI